MSWLPSGVLRTKASKICVLVYPLGQSGGLSLRVRISLNLALLHLVLAFALEIMSTLATR